MAPEKKKGFPSVIGAFKENKEFLEMYIKKYF